MLENLVAHILSSEYFIAQMAQLSTLTAAESMGISVPEVTPDIDYLIGCAGAFTKSDLLEVQQAALSIAYYALLQGDERLKLAGIMLFDNMGNQPAIKLASSRGLVELPSSETWPLPLRLDRLANYAESSVLSLSGRELLLNPFQKQVWEGVLEARRLSISAPTSAGKSYILKQVIEEILLSSPMAAIVYLVPTRALIQEVTEELVHRLIREAGMKVYISNTPLDHPFRGKVQEVLVFTQERYKLWLGRVPVSWSPTALFVDEAQKLGDGARGLLLQRVIAETLRRSKDVRLIFAAPSVRNPAECLLGLAPSNDALAQRVVKSNVATVSQNIFWINSVRRFPKKFIIEHLVHGAASTLCDVEVVAKPIPEGKRLPFVAHRVGKSLGSTVVYVNGQAEAEKVALILAELQGTEADTGDLDDLRQVAREAVHPKYRLDDTLKRRVAFHYGNMPQILRQEIEEQFKRGSVEFLVCTSTLLEGVNLPCRSLFMRGPKRGAGHPMESADFWNLAGRAGRWGREFQGNIFCVDTARPNVWESEIPLVRSESSIVKAAESVLADDAFMPYVTQGGPVAVGQVRPDFEAMHNYLLSGIIQSSAEFEAISSDAQALASIKPVLLAQAEELVLPAELLAKHASVSPVAMDRLYRSMIAPEGTVLIPPSPGDQDAVATYADVFQTINQFFGDPFKGRGGAFKFALLTVAWMKGDPIPRMIEQRVKYMEKARRRVDLPKVIREVLDDVEKFARFVVPRYLSCYCDIAGAALSERGEAAPSELIDFATLMEFGVSIRTQVSLISIGLSRTTAVTLSELIVEDDLEPEAAVRWLLSRDLDKLSLSRVALKEINDALYQYKSLTSVS